MQRGRSFLVSRTRCDEISTTTRRWVWKFTACPLWYLTFCHLLIISFAVRRDCGPFKYYRGVDGEAKPDVTPEDRGDVPRDGCHHHEVPCRDQLPRQPGSTTVSTVPPSSSSASTNCSHAAPSSSSRPPYHAAFYPARPPAHPPLRMSPLGGHSLRGPAPTRAPTSRGPRPAPRGPAPRPAPVLAGAAPVPFSSLGATLPLGNVHYSMSNHIQILDCIN
jgi:hypothetical protein